MTQKLVGSAVLVVGGAGYVGGHVADALSQAGNRVVVLDNLSGGLRRVISPAATFYEGDVANGSLLRAIIELHRVSAIVHSAVTRGPPGLQSDDPVAIYRNNICGLISLLECAVACGVSNVLLSSTAAADRSETALRPRFAHPGEAFVRSMMIEEQILRDAAAAHRFGYGILRYVEVAGGDGEQNPPHAAGRYMNLIQESAQVALGKLHSVSIRSADDTPDGTAIRDYVHITDLAQAHVAALDQLQGGATSSLELDISYGRGYSDLEVLEAAERVTNMRIPRATRRLNPEEPAVLVADARTTMKRLDWVPRHADLDEMFRSTFRAELRDPANGAA